MSGKLKGKVALITGTSGGQGRAAALLFAAEGAKVVGCGRSNTRAADETVSLVRAAGGEMISFSPVDLTDSNDVKALVKNALAAYGSIDILFNNAASCRFQPLEQCTVDDWNFTLHNELTLVFLTIKELLPIFKDQGYGVIINTTSVAATTGSGLPGNAPGGFAHAAAKAGLSAITRALACELAPVKVRINSIEPGPIAVPSLAHLYDGGGPFRNVALDSILLDRPGAAEDIARAALFLASDDSEWITGANLVVDGGYSACGGAGLTRSKLIAEAITDLKYGYEK